jgi:hypothetical protein
MNSKRVYLSKSKLMSARQCLKRLHLEINRPELLVISPSTQAASRSDKNLADEVTGVMSP